MKNKETKNTALNLTAAEYEELFEIESAFDVIDLNHRITSYESKVSSDAFNIDKDIKDLCCFQTTDFFWNVMVLKLLHRTRDIYNHMNGCRINILRQFHPFRQFDKEQEWGMFREYKSILYKIDIGNVINDHDEHWKEYPGKYFERFTKIKIGNGKTLL